MYTYTSSPRTRRGGSCLKEIYIYKTFLIYRTCMRCVPAKPVRACTLRKLCRVSHVTFEAPLRTSHFSLHSSHSTLHTSHFTLLLVALCEAVAQMLSKNMTRARPRRNATPSKHFLHTSHCTLHTSHLHFTLALRTRHFISQIMWALLTSSPLFSSHPVSSHMSIK